MFFFTDIHGMGELFDAVINYCKKQDATRSIIFGGDACDRGPNGYRIIKTLLNDPHIIYLKGNHEDLFIAAAYELVNKLTFTNITDVQYIQTVLSRVMSFDYKYPALQFHIDNGGMPTLIDWIQDGMPMTIIKQLEKLPYTHSYKQYDFCHAASVYRVFNNIQILSQQNKEIPPDLVKSITWDRGAFSMGWEPNRMAVFGHTPTPFIKRYLELPDNKNDPSPYKWRGSFDKRFSGWKLAMDTATACSKYIYLFDCQTNNIIGFQQQTNDIIQLPIYKI